MPISIVALDSETLEFRGIQRLEDLGLHVPNIVLIGGGASGETSGNFHMRGIPGIATYVDGVWQSTQEAFGLVGARLAYEPPTANWRLSVFGTNLNNEKYLNSGMVSGAFSVDAATVGHPREAGASLQIFFD